MDLSKLLTGYKTYLAAAGLFGLGVYQISQGNMEVGIQSLLAGLAAFGIRTAVANANSA